MSILANIPGTSTLTILTPTSTTDSDGQTTTNWVEGDTITASVQIKNQTHITESGKPITRSVIMVYTDTNSITKDNRLKWGDEIIIIEGVDNTFSNHLQITGLLNND